MKQVRPYRYKEVFAAPCIICKEEIESDTLPVPWLCNHCKQEIKNQIVKGDTQITSTIEQISETIPKVCKNCGSYRIGIQDKTVIFKCGTLFNLPPRDKWRVNCQSG